MEFPKCISIRLDLIGFVLDASSPIFAYFQQTILLFHSLYAFSVTQGTCILVLHYFWTPRPHSYLEGCPAGEHRVTLYHVNAAIVSKHK